MKRLLANVVVAIGCVIALAGLLGTPLVSDLLPASWSVPGQSGSSHLYLRWVPTEPQPAAQMPYLWLLVGVAIL
ncbi:hypothetical protein, partial [Lysobacter xanthus]